MSQRGIALARHLASLASKWAFAILCLTLALEVQASDPLETGAKGSFEILPRLDPARSLPGEDLFLKITIRALKPYETGPHPPGLIELTSDPDSGFAGKFRIKPLEQENPERIPEGAAGPPGTVWTFDYQITPLRQPDGSYPGELPEFGLVLTRTDIPWPRLARQFTWLGPFPLRYAEAGEEIARQPGRTRFLPWWSGLALAAIGSFLIALWEGFFWRRSVRRAWDRIDRSRTEPKALRDLLHRWLVSRAVVLPAEPVPAEIGRQVTKAGYPQTLADKAQTIWSEVNQARFGRAAIDAEVMNALAQRASAFVGDWNWVPWKRRLINDRTVLEQ